MGVKYEAEQLDNISRLKDLREFIGFSLAEMQRITGINESQLRRIEKGENLPFPRTYNKLALVFGWAKVKVSPKRRAPARTLDITPDFVIGHVYSIQDTGGGKRYDMHVFDIECLFRFEGKQGELLRFMEIHGGWTLTYAPYQLIGKKIKEIKQ